jgi:hypothetical protein
MGKPPPFQFKPQKAATKGADAGVQLLGSGDVPATYSDVFVVTAEVETGMASIFFYQRLLADRTVVLGKTEERTQTTKAKCVHRIVMSSQGITALLQSLATNRGFTLTPIKKEKE